MYPLALPTWVMLRSGYWGDRAAMANHVDDLYRRQVRPSVPGPDVWALLGQHPSHFVNEMLMVLIVLARKSEVGGMTVAAPPQAPHVWETKGEEPRDALIREARRRARRRRCAYGVVAFLIAIAAGAFLGRGEGTAPPPSNAAGNNRTPPRAPDSPLVRGPDVASTLLASWGQMHAGYVLVYGDGRALWYPDSGVLVQAQRRMFTIPWRISRPADGPVFVDADGRVIGPADGHTFEGARHEHPVLERHLSPAGLDLVRTRRLDLHRLAVGLFNSRDELWVEPTVRRYEPSKHERGSYVGCIAGALAVSEYRTALEAAGLSNVSIDFSHAVGEGVHAAIIRATKVGVS